MGWGENDRGVSFTFGAEVAAKFLHKHDFDLICRAHQVVEDGYEFFAKRQLVTLFSAPNYCGEFDNAGAMMSVDETLMCSFQILKVRIFLPLLLNIFCLNNLHPSPPAVPHLIISSPPFLYISARRQEKVSLRWIKLWSPHDPTERRKPKERKEMNE